MEDISANKIEVCSVKETALDVSYDSTLRFSKRKSIIINFYRVFVHAKQTIIFKLILMHSQICIKKTVVVVLWHFLWTLETVNTLLHQLSEATCIHKVKQFHKTLFSNNGSLQQLTFTKIIYFEIYQSVNSVILFVILKVITIELSL